MTSEGSDLASLKSWQSAFEYPLATTRQIEKALCADVSSNKDRLRTLVGASYRDLLSTAESIISLDGTTQNAESSLADLSRSCNSDLIEQSFRSLRLSSEAEDVKRQQNRTIAAQISLLQRCGSCIARLLKQRQSVLLTSKILAVSRLLLQTLSRDSAAPPVLDILRGQLGDLRSRLLRRIDRCFQCFEAATDGLVEALCAFCLATSSSSSDALRHYQHLRLQQIRAEAENSRGGQSSMVQALRIYIKSLQSTKALLGRTLSDAFRALKKQAILRDPKVRELEDLDLDTLQRWIAADVQDFVPFVKHSDHGSVQVKSTTSAWSKEALVCLQRVLERLIQTTHNPMDLLDLRKALLAEWLPVCVSTPSHSGAEVLDTLRDVINSQMSTIIARQTYSLAHVSDDVKKILSTHDNAPAASSLWEGDFVASSTGKGGSSFKEQLKFRHLGATKSIASLSTSLELVISHIEEMKSTIEQLKRERWQDQVEEDEDDDELAARVEQTLRNTDPGRYEDDLAKSSTQSLTDCQTSVREIADAVYLGSDASRVRSLLRIIREINQRLRRAFPDAQLDELESAVPTLTERLANDLVKQVPLPPKSRPSSSIAQLWEGNPPLPVQPSPSAIKLLRQLTSCMADHGEDLWTSTAVPAAKVAMARDLIEKNFLLPDSSKATNGLPNDLPHINGDTSHAVNFDHVQGLFDAHYLDNALASSESSHLQHSTQELAALSELEETELNVVKKRAKDYWARTSLLFGLLA